MEGHPNDLPLYYSNIILMIWFKINFFQKYFIKNKIKLYRFTGFYNSAAPFG